MPPFPKWIPLALLLATFTCAPLAGAKKHKAAPRPKPAAAEPELHVFADEKTYTEEKLHARGHVEIVWGDYRIYADEIEYNFKSRVLTADGRVTMSAKETVLSGEKLQLNVRTRRGELVEAFGLVSPTVGYETDRLVQTGVDTFTFNRLKLTSCVQIAPRWRITCRKGTIKRDRYVDMRDVWFRVKGVPILYLPAMRYPVGKDGRATGFLFPSIGFSRLRGFSLLNSFFWAIRSNLDLTLSADYYGKMGWGFGQEARYLFRGVEGNVKFYRFGYNDLFRSDPARTAFERTLKSDYYLQGTHMQDLPFLNSRLVAKAHLQSRPNFMRLLSNTFDRSINTNFMTSAQWKSSWRSLSLTARASRQETYYNELDKSNMLQYLPQVALRMKQQRLGPLPLYLSWSAQYDNYRRGGVSYEDEAAYVTDITSRRMRLEPALQVPLLRLPFLRLSLKGESSFSRYDKRRDPDSRKVVEEPIWVVNHTAEATLQGPSFFRVFHSRRARFKHVIEPTFKARYAAPVDNTDQVLTIDGSDYPSFSYAGAALTTRLFMKSAPYKGSPREILTYSIGQDYYFDPEAAHRFRPVEGEFPKFSVLAQQLRARPFSGLSLDASLDYHHTLRMFTRAVVGLRLERKSLPVSGRFHLSSYRSPYNSSVIYNRTVVGGELNVAAPSFPVRLDSGASYDFAAKEFRDAYLRATLDYQCVLLTAEFKIITRYISGVLLTDPSFRVSVSLGNLGIVSDLLGGGR